MPRRRRLPIRPFLSAALLSLALLPRPGLAQDGAETALSGLSYPWDLEARDGALWITEKAGTIGRYQDGAFRRMPVRTAVPILDHRGGGLMGLALRPDFATTRRAVVYHHAGTPEARYNRVVEVELRGAGDGAEWAEVRPLVARIPGHPLYNGGRVAFGPDGMLYVTTGWTARRGAPQDLSDLAGKILRLTPDGAVPADNPFPGSPVWSLGHRNPQGLAWDGDGVMYAAEHGQSGHDEVNRIEKGGNYGWPLVEGDETRDGMRAPLAHSGGATWAPSGLAWFDGGLLVAGLRARGILGVSAAGAARLRHGLGARVRDVAVGPGALWAITTERSPRREGRSDDRLIRIPR